MTLPLCAGRLATLPPDVRRPSYELAAMRVGDGRIDFKAIFCYLNLAR